MVCYYNHELLSFMNEKNMTKESFYVMHELLTSIDIIESFMNQNIFFCCYFCCYFDFHYMVQLYIYRLDDKIEKKMFFFFLNPFHCLNNVLVIAS